MAYLSATHLNPSFSVVRVLSNIGKAISGFFAAVIHAQSRQTEIQALQAMTDTQLATKFGIAREDIVSYVFRDKI